MFTDKPLTRICPQKENPDLECHKQLVYQALHGVELSYESTCQLENILTDVCNFCIKKHNQKNR